jgi:hypothetical protein
MFFAKLNSKINKVTVIYLTWTVSADTLINKVRDGKRSQWDFNYQNRTLSILIRRCFEIFNWT